MKKIFITLAFISAQLAQATLDDANNIRGFVSAPQNNACQELADINPGKFEELLQSVEQISGKLKTAEKKALKKALIEKIEGFTGARVIVDLDLGMGWRPQRIQDSVGCTILKDKLEEILKKH